MITAVEAHDELQRQAEQGRTPEDILVDGGVDVSELLSYAIGQTSKMLAQYGITDLPLTLAQALMIGVSVGFQLGREAGGTDQ